jgi:hypothetical protein
MFLLRKVVQELIYLVPGCLIAWKVCWVRRKKWVSSPQVLKRQKDAGCMGYRQRLLSAIMACSIVHGGPMPWPLVSKKPAWDCSRMLPFHAGGDFPLARQFMYENLSSAYSLNEI